MLHTRVLSAGAVLLGAVCLLLPGSGRSDEKAPPPKSASTDRSQAREEMEAKLAGRAPAEVVAFVEQLAQEWIARKGAYELAHHRFTAQMAEAGKARQRLDDLKPPAPVPLVLRAADVEAALKAEQAVVDYHATRVKHLEAWKDALAALATACAEFGRAARAADDHLWTLRTAAPLAAKAGAGKRPDAAGAKSIDDAAARLKTLGADVQTALDKAKSDSAEVEKQRASARAASDAAAVKLDALKGAQADTLASFKFDEQACVMTPAQLADEFAKSRKSLTEKTGAIAGDAGDYQKASGVAAEARAALGALKEPPPPVDTEPFEALAPLERTARRLAGVQQHLAARVRNLDEREEKVNALVSALDELEKRAVAYLATLDDVRRLVAQVTALATETERRVGRGDLDAAKVSGGFDGGDRAPFDIEARAVALAISQLRQEREQLRKPDPETENIKSLTTHLLARVNERLNLLVDLKKLAGDYATARKDRPEAEQKRLDQRTTERVNKDTGEWDWLLAFDRSKAGADAAELLTADYRELIDHDERADILKRQKEALESLIDLGRHEAADIAKLRTVLEKRVTTSEGARKWDDWLRSRIAPNGLKVEEDVYRDEVAKLNAAALANARRVEALTGNSATEASKVTEQTKLPAAGGEIGKARAELRAARIRGMRETGIKIGIILLGALLLPHVLLFVLGRKIRGGSSEAGSPSPVLAALRGVLKAGTWIAAVALVLSTLGFDVTALVIALAIGALAIALAARPMIADVLGSVVIFAERRFKVGDVVRLGTGDPARVVGLTWRSTALKNTNGLVVSVPNRKVTELTVENLSRGGETYDAIAVTVSTDKDAGKVVTVLRGAMSQCKNVSADNGVTVVRYSQKGHVKVVEYRFWWFLKDYEMRNKTRDEVFARIALGLGQEDMAGIEVTLG
ncbi:mechanosensitive ion channel [Gemmata sp. G18]|uniref:Mechanosensitive ion channel n=1 Tax=Gemmata palustris TaxID=2822762 RepID=A0ABS5BVK7_9BACT|nr:mechanosensitive ion channel family protein [Gemmata palustris]MBP3957753.1 mechanosensitive ion channel [Gemmata palustris]